jgi:hypothetical protein
MEDQWYFFTDQRIKGALSTEKQWNWREPEKKDMWSSVSGRFPDGEGRPPWQKSFPVETRPRGLDHICGLKPSPVSLPSFDPLGRREPGSKPARTMAGRLRLVLIQFRLRRLTARKPGSPPRTWPSHRGRGRTG